MEPIPEPAEPGGFTGLLSGWRPRRPHACGGDPVRLMLDKRQREHRTPQALIGPKKLSPETMYWALRLTAQDIRARAGMVSGPFPIDHGRGFRSRFWLRLCGRYVRAIQLDLEDSDESACSRTTARTAVGSLRRGCYHARRGSARPFFSRFGAWRSLVAHLHGCRVASSNLAAPTNLTKGFAR